MLISVPNVSEGRDQATLDALARGVRARLLVLGRRPPPGGVHARGRAGRAAPAGAQRRQSERSSASTSPITRACTRAWAPSTSRRSSTSTRTTRAPPAPRRSCSPTRSAGSGVPVYLYGELGGGRTRAELRKPGGLDHHTPDFGPHELHPTAGATLVAARPPLVAFNVEIDAPLDTAKQIAKHLRAELDVRALGLQLSDRDPGLDEHRGPHANDRRAKWSPRSANTPGSPAPSSSRPPRERRSQTSRKTCRSEARRRWKIIYPRRSTWPRRSARGGPSIAAMPRARSRRAAAPVASSPPRSRSAASRGGAATRACASRRAGTAPR